ncbi:MAG TPA: hypothetical protein VF648_18965 [Pyrinomonadaceae bacterium]|jgi:predicted nuclease with TOPRIM domain
MKTVAVILLKMLLAYLGSNLDREAQAELDDYNRRKAAAEAEHEKSAAEIIEIQKSNALLEEGRQKLAAKRVLLAGEVLEIQEDLEKKEHETADKLRRIDDISDSDILRSDF